MVYFAAMNKIGNARHLRGGQSEWNIKISQMSLEKLRVLLLKGAVDIVPNYKINCLLPE